MSLIVHPSQRCGGSVTFRGGPKRQQLLTDKFSRFQLMDRARNSPFGQFFSGLEFQFCPQLIHQLLLRKVHSSRDNEIQFLIGSAVCRFGKCEFGLVSGLSFVADYTDEQWNEYTKSRRLTDTYFRDTPIVRLSTLEAVFSVCSDVDDVWRLGLCYFIEGILFGFEDTHVIWRDMLYLVDEPNNFFRYPWGDMAFKMTLEGLKKDMLHYCSGQPGDEDDEETDKDKNHKGKRKRTVKAGKSSAKYTLHGWMPSLQFWAFETVTQFGAGFATHLGDKFPRMLSWTNNKSPNSLKINTILKQHKLNIIPLLQPRPTELDYIRANRLEEVSAATHADHASPIGQDSPAATDAPGSSGPSATYSCSCQHPEMARLTADMDELKRSHSLLINTVNAQHSVLIHTVNEKFDYLFRLLAQMTPQVPPPQPASSTQTPASHTPLATDIINGDHKPILFVPRSTEQQSPAHGT